jgi:hypothetical protein
LFYDNGVLESSWGLHGRISRCRVGLARHCAGFVAGEFQRAGISGSVWGRGWLKELVDISLFFFSCSIFHLVSLYHGLKVDWPRLVSTSISLSFLFSCLDFHGLHLGYGYGGRGERFAFFAMVPGLLWRLHLLRTQPLISVFGAGGARLAKHIRDSWERARAKRCLGRRPVF